MRTVIATISALLLVACGGGSEKTAKDPNQYDPEHVSEEQNQNEVDPFFEGEKPSRATEKVDLGEESEDKGEPE